MKPVHVLEWLDQELLPNPISSHRALALTKEVAIQKWPQYRIDCTFAERWPGHDPLPEVDAEFKIVEVFRWLTIVEKATDSEAQIALSDIPSEVRINRRVGQSWYDILVYVLVPTNILENG